MSRNEGKKSSTKPIQVIFVASSDISRWNLGETNPNQVPAASALMLSRASAITPSTSSETSRPWTPRGTPWICPWCSWLLIHVHEFRSFMVMSYQYFIECIIDSNIESPCLGNLRNLMLTHGPWAGTFEVPAAISRPWGSILMAARMPMGKLQQMTLISHDLSSPWMMTCYAIFIHFHPFSSIFHPFHPFDRSFQPLSFLLLPHHPPGCMISENSTPGIGTHFLGSAEMTVLQSGKWP